MRYLSGGYGTGSNRSRVFSRPIRGCGNGHSPRVGVAVVRPSNGAATKYFFCNLKRRGPTRGSDNVRGGQVMGRETRGVSIRRNVGYTYTTTSKTMMSNRVIRSATVQERCPRRVATFPYGSRCRYRGGACPTGSVGEGVWDFIHTWCV